MFDFIRALGALISMIERDADTGEWTLSIRVKLLDPEDNYLLFVPDEIPEGQ